jgi:beta-galactosidase
MGTEQDPYLGRSSKAPTWYVAKNVPYVIGHHLWTGVDYLGESKTSLGGSSGFLDNCIFRKSWFYFQQSQWTDTPMVHIAIGDGTTNNRNLAENWNQAGPVSVVTYTNCDTVDLYVNASKIGTKNASDFARNGIMQWTNVPWEAGTIKAVAMKGGREAAADSIKTAGAPARVLLKPDRTVLYADGECVSCIEVDILDADGNPVSTADNTVSFTMTGPCRSIGIASGDFSNNQPFKAASRKAYKGKALIVIQSTVVPGTIGVTVNSDGLSPAAVTLTSR